MTNTNIVPTQTPTVAVNESYDSLDDDYTGQYLLFMLDPDASYPENPTNRWIIHYWQEGLTKSTSASDINNTDIGGTLLVNSTAARVDFRRPRPPTNSSAHRYILYLFEQPSNFQIPQKYSGYGPMNSTRFPFEEFLDDTDLDDPVAANYFYCSNETAVPDTFVAAPGQAYPGGNGAMITQGTNNPTPTGSGSGAASSATGGPVSSTPAEGCGVSHSGNAAMGMILAIGATWALL